jgi:hypothetical protein
VRRVIANDETLGICAIRFSHVRDQRALRDTSELRGLGMRMGGDREIHAPRCADIRL